VPINGKNLIASSPLTLAFLFALVTAFPAQTQEAEWTLEKEKNGISLYLRDFPGSKIPEFKGVIRVKSSMASIVALLLDIESCTEWIHQCGDSFLIEVINPKEQYVYQINKLPFVKDRDIILRATLDHFNNGKLVVIRLEAQTKQCRDLVSDVNQSVCKNINRKKYVRVVDSSGSYQLKQVNDQEITITWQQHIDPGGRLPKWLIRSQLLDIPMHTLNNLRDMVNKNKYQNTSLVFDEKYIGILETLNH